MLYKNLTTSSSESTSTSASFSEDVITKISEKIFEKIDQRFSKMEEMINNLVSQLNINSNKMAELEKRIDSNEQFSRLNNLRVYGIKDSENGNNTVDAVLSLFKNKLGVELSKSSIDRCHRIGTFNPRKSRPVLVRFMTFQDRSDVYKNKKLLKKSGLVIREDLTKSRLEILKQAVNKMGPRNTWTSNGNIYIVHENRKIIVKCISDLPN